MADINVTINPAPSVSATVSAAPEVDVTIGEGISKHAVTHAPGGSDSLEAYYATTGSLAYVSGLTSGVGNTGYLTGYVLKTETGDFYPVSNPSGFITGVDLSNYVTGQVVRPSETGDFITNSETGVFYPNSNPSGFITGVDLSSYATTAYVTGVSGSLQTQITNLSNSTGSYVTGSVVRPSETGVFVTTGQTGQFVTGSVVRPSETGDFVTNSETGAFYPTSNPSGFITGVDLSAYVTGQVVRPSETGDFVTNSQTGAFYPVSNPSGFITGVDLSGYVTGSVVRPSETGDFITSSQTGSFYPTSNPSGFITGVDLSAYVTGDVVRPSETGLFLTTGAADARYVGLTGDQTVSGIKNFASRPTVNGTGVLLSGEGGAAANTGELTGVFYPLNSNPSGYITGVDLSSYATQSFVTGVSGHLQGQVNTLNGQTGNYVTGSVVRPSETGNFVTTGQTGVFVTGSVVRPSETGNFITTAQTGAFYPSSNPSGFITGVDLSAYVTGAVVRPSETGAFLTTGAADGRYALQSATGNFITTAQTGAFYPISNPSGFITGVDLSSYATQSFVTGISGDLQTKLNTVSGYAVTGYDDSITGISVTGNSTKTITLFQRDGGNLSASFTDASGALLENVVYTTGNQDISGLKDFQTRPTVTDIPVLISGDPVDIVHLYAKNDESITIYKGQPVYIEGANGSNPLIKVASNTGEFSSSKTIGLLAQNLLVNELGYIITEGILEGFDTSAGNAGDPMWLGPTGNILYGTGNKPYGLNNLVYLGVVLRSQANNGKVYVQIQNGFEIEELHNVYALNPSNKDALLYNSASGAWFARQITTGDVSGISNYVLKSETGNFITTSQTGQFVGDSETGAFLTTGAADGRYALQSETGVFVTTGQTGQFVTGAVVRPTETGAFLTTGAADSRYALQSATGNFITTAQTGQFYPTSNPSGYITGVDLSAYVTGAVVRPSETGGFVSILGDQSISGIKTFNSGILISATGGSDTNAFQIKNIVDPNNPSLNALMISPTADGTRRMYFGEGDKDYFAINLQNVGRFESFPPEIFPDADFTIRLNYNTNLYLSHVPSQNSAILPMMVSQEDSLPNDGYFKLLANSKNTGSGSALVIDTKYQKTGGYLFEARVTGVNRFSLDVSGNISGNGASFVERPTVGSIGVALTGDLTGYASKTETGAFLTTGAADARYYGLANGQSISGYAITGYNDAVTGMSVTGDTTKTITLFQRDGTTVTANFADNASSGSNDTGYLTGYVSKSETGNIAVGAISLSLNGGGSTITTGYKSFTTVTFSGEILEYTILADRTGSIVIDVWKDSYGNFPLTTGDSICVSSKPTLATGIKNTDSTLTSWTKTFSAGDVFGFNVDSVSGVTNVNLTLKVKKA
jgi:hypothetical protein